MVLAVCFLFAFGWIFGEPTTGGMLSMVVPGAGGTANGQLVLALFEFFFW